ncbi:MAG: Fic family protein, partial [Myxococcaceae bacterium]
RAAPNAITGIMPIQPAGSPSIVSVPSSPTETEKKPTTPGSAAVSEKNAAVANDVRDGVDAPVELKPGEARGPQLLNDKVTFFEKLENPNFFGELDDTKEFVLDGTTQAQAEKALNALRGERSASRFFSGDLSRLNSARFVNRYNRMDGDFRYAYGETAYRRWQEADAVLNAIPRGSLADSLSVDLIKIVGAAAFVKGDEPLSERIGHAFRALQGRGIQPGAIRSYTTQTTPEDVLPKEEIENIEALGLDYDEVGIDNGKGKAVIKYPPPDVMNKRLAALIEDTRAALKDPNCDIIKVAARFGQTFIALHPLQDLNGRVGRLLMDRILAERGLPPPILKDTGADYSVSAETYRSEVAKGISRMVRGATTGSTAGSGYEYMATAAQLGADPLASVEPVLVNGMKYALGKDGFVYNEAGRAHLVDDQAVFHPLTQLQLYFAARRVYQSADPAAALDALTAETRKAFTRMTPSARQKMQIAPDREAMSADNAYRVGELPVGNAARYAQLFDPKLAKADKLFTGADRKSSQVSFALSRYQQIDHELYLVQHAASDSGDDKTAETIRGYRSELFDMAKKFIADHKDKTRISPENPNGFRFGFEQIEFENSALAFKSFEDAEYAAGDEMVVYRGDASAVRLTGIHPDGVFTHKDGKQVAEFREARKGTTNILKELNSVLGSSGGTGYQSTTTDLALLAKESGFADKTDTFTVDLQALPQWLQSAVKQRLGKGETLSVDSLRDMASFAVSGKLIPEGYVDVSGVKPELLEGALRKTLKVLSPEKQTELRSRITTAREGADEKGFARRILSGLSDHQALVRVDDLFEGGPKDAVNQLQNEIGNLRDFIMVRRDPVNENAVRLSSHRRAYKLAVNRDAGMVAPGTLGQGRFHFEQEISLHDTGLDSTPPWAIKKAYTQDELAREFPITKPEPVKPEGLQLSSPSTIPSANPATVPTSTPVDVLNPITTAPTGTPTIPVTPTESTNGVVSSPVAASTPIVPTLGEPGAPAML